jgi:GNAT superfamily N-acetyltransferase
MTVAPELLRDGARVDVRPTTRADAALLEGFYAALSPGSRALRFLCAGLDMRAAARSLVADDVVGLLATSGDHVLGHGVLIAGAPATAEVAFAVADVDQHRGVATLLLEHLVEEAAHRGLARLTAEVDPTNDKMVEVFADVGLTVSTRRRDGTLHVELDATLTPSARARIAARHAGALSAASRISGAHEASSPVRDDPSRFSPGPSIRKHGCDL